MGDGGRQACIGDMPGVVRWRQEVDVGVPSTLYLGVEDVNALRARLTEATAAEDTETM